MAASHILSQVEELVGQLSAVEQWQLIGKLVQQLCRIEMRSKDEALAAGHLSVGEELNQNCAVASPMS